MLPDMGRDATIARLAAGKAKWRSTWRCEGRHPHGESRYVEHNAERAIVARIRQMHVDGISAYRIASQLRAEGIRTRYSKEFSGQTAMNLLRRVVPSAVEPQPRSLADSQRGASLRYQPFYNLHQEQHGPEVKRETGDSSDTLFRRQ